MLPLLDSLDEQQAMALLESLGSYAAPALGRMHNALLDGSPPSSSDAKTGDTQEPPTERMWEPDLRYRSLVEKLPVVTFMASLDDTLQELYVSPQIETMLGFTQKEWLDNPILWYRQLHPDDREKWVEEFARTCGEGVNFRAEYRLFARDGHVVWVQGECQLVRDDDGRPLFLQGIAIDITHLKKATLVEEARVAAEAASHAKSEFLARMSHEIRTPLNGVVGMIDMLATTSLTDMQQRYARLAREAADSLLSVINDILDFSKIEAGKVEIEAIEFDLQKMIEDLTVLLAPVAMKKGLAIASFVRPEIPRRLIGDPGRVRQVLTNLITNALKFTERGRVNIRAALVPGGGENALGVRIEVQDTGIGIPPDRLDRLFKSFSQVDTSTTRKFGGTGLGLAICKRLVELMGGEIGINSEAGQGTTFWFTLKLGIIEQSTVPQDSAEALRAVRVLALESEQTHQMILVEQLDGRLIHAPVIVDHDKALGVLRQAAKEGHPFNVVLVAYGPDASAFASRVKEDPSLPKTRLIAITPHDDRTDTQTILREGFFTRLQRPLTQSQLIDTFASATVVRVADPPAKPVSPGDAHASLKGLHVLVAEDHEMNQFVTQQTLLRVGCTCDIVPDGAIAVEAVFKHPYAAVLMDCQMPDVDGLEATRRIRAREIATGRPRIPIIALTAEAISGDREKCIAAGMDGYVSKPINSKDLFAELASLVGPNRSIAEEAKPPATTDPTTPWHKPADVAATPPNPGDVAAENRPVVRPAGEPSAQPVAPEAKARPAVSLAADVPIDAKALLARCMHDVPFATRLLEKFGQRATGDVELLRAKIASGDSTAAGRLAHNLKSVAAQVSAEKLRAIAFEIEQAGARRDLDFIEKQLAVLDEEARRCAAYIPRAIEGITHVSPEGASAAPLR